jgi:hypothetical protein
MVVRLCQSGHPGLYKRVCLQCQYVDQSENPDQHKRVHLQCKKVDILTNSGQSDRVDELGIYVMTFVYIQYVYLLYHNVYITAALQGI